MYNAEEE